MSNDPDLQDLVSSQLQLIFEDVDTLSSHNVTMSDGKLRNLIAFIHSISLYAVMFWKALFHQQLVRTVGEINLLY